MRPLLLALCVGLAACTASRPVDPAALASREEVGGVIVTPRGELAVYLADARVQGDSLRGEVDGQPRAYAVADLERVVHPRSDNSVLGIDLSPRSSPYVIAAVVVGGVLLVLHLVGEALNEYAFGR